MASGHHPNTQSKMAAKVWQLIKSKESTIKQSLPLVNGITQKNHYNWVFPFFIVFSLEQSFLKIFTIKKMYCLLLLLKHGTYWIIPSYSYGQVSMCQECWYCGLTAAIPTRNEMSDRMLHATALQVGVGRHELTSGECM
jgi:hypothetical protein